MQRFLGNVGADEARGTCYEYLFLQCDEDVWGSTRCYILTAKLRKNINIGKLLGFNFGNLNKFA